MPEKRIIPVLSYCEEELIKTIGFKKRQYIGDALNAVKIFNEKFVDEIILLDIGPENRSNYSINFVFLKNLLNECFIPATYGGAIKNVEDAKKVFDLGVDKISLNSIVKDDVSCIEKFANKFGSQSIIASVDVQKDTKSKYKIYNYTVDKIIEKDELIDYLVNIQNYGAGEIIINSVDKDGLMKGIDLDLIIEAKKVCKIPIIYYGGVGSLNDIKLALSSNIDAVACTSFFCFYGKNKSVLITYPYQELENLK